MLQITHNLFYHNYQPKSRFFRSVLNDGQPFNHHKTGEKREKGQHGEQQYKAIIKA